MNPLAIGSNFTKVKETKGKVKKMLEITKLTEFDESAIRATVLGEIYRMVEEKKENHIAWYVDDAKVTIANFEDKLKEDPDAEPDWEVRNAYSEISANEYKVEVYDEILRALRKML